MTTISRMTARIALTGLVIATGFAANAATDGESKEGKMRKERPSFSALDTDGNGQLTVEELSAQARVRFDKIDTNGDGQLSANELGQTGKKRAEKRAAKMIERADANGDGTISFEELSAGKRGERQAKMFERADADGNGSISEEEFAEIAKHHRGGGKHKRQKSGE